MLEIVLSTMLIENGGNEPSAIAAKERSEQGNEVLSLYASDVNCIESSNSLLIVEERKMPTGSAAMTHGFGKSGNGTPFIRG